MALQATAPRPDFVAAIEYRLSQIIGRPDFRNRRLSRVDPLDVRLAVPHDVFTVRSTHLRDGALVAGATRIAQRFLILDGDVPVSSVELADADGTGFMLTEGPYVDATARSIRRAELDPQLSGTQVRVLRLAAIHVMVLWLHGDDAEKNFFIPMAPAPYPLRPDHRYRAAEISAALLTIIDRFREQPVSEEG